MALSHGRFALRSFYVRLKGTNPTVAVLAAEDIIYIALFEDEKDKTPVQDNVNHLRAIAKDLPERQRKLLDVALSELGYS